MVSGTAPASHLLAADQRMRLVLTAILVFLLVGCGGSTATSTQNDGQLNGNWSLQAIYNTVDDNFNAEVSLVWNGSQYVGTISEPPGTSPCDNGTITAGAPNAQGQIVFTGTILNAPITLTGTIKNLNPGPALQISGTYSTSGSGCGVVAANGTWVMNPQ